MCVKKLQILIIILLNMVISQIGHQHNHEHNNEIGIALGINFVSILLITIMLFLLMMYVRTSDNYGEYNIGSNSVKFLSSVTFLLCWIIGFMVHSLL